MDNFILLVVPDPWLSLYTETPMLSRRSAMMRPPARSNHLVPDLGFVESAVTEREAASRLIVDIDHRRLSVRAGVSLTRMTFDNDVCVPG